jgi:hypothetical protein
MDLVVLSSYFIKQLTSWTYIFIFLFIISNIKKKWIYDTLFALGMGVGIIGVMFCLYHKIILHYSNLLNISTTFSEVFCNISHLLLIIFLIFYKPVLSGKSHIFKSFAALVSVCMTYLFLVDPKAIYQGVPINTFITFSSGICLLILYLRDDTPI